MTEYRTINITPEVAGDMLANNYENNRRVNPRAVRALVNDMREGRYISQNGQTIIVTKSGKLIDGQHRLSAIRESGVALTFLVAIVDDDEERAFSTIDCGKPRTLNQFIKGTNKTNVAALARVAYAIEYGESTLYKTLDGRIDSTGTRPSIPALTEFANTHEDELRRTVNAGERIYDVNKCGARSMFGAAIWLVRYLNRDAHIDAFVDDVCALIPERQISAAFVRYINNHRHDAKSSSRMRNDMAIATLYAYDRYCDGSRAVYFKSASLEKTQDAYDKLLQMQRVLRNSDIPLCGADNV